jgi:hypothetical protein
MRRSDKKKSRNLSKTEKWSLKEAQKTIDSWKSSRRLGMFKSNKTFGLKQIRNDKFVQTAWIPVGEPVVILDLVPSTTKTFFSDSYRPLVVAIVLTQCGISYITFDEHQTIDLLCTSPIWASFLP